ncbi:hypothetical protein [uncultured Pseudosulfitobacter sp.]|uniref:hypothetical protein n=1 Tax=uncultured Pseudosulfitobacter sp. TaxID=2854214 RepID=UPI0030D7F2B3|tara:strand:+ start:5667 stop:5867 length:201 start_codon:yes stop_codon:yes gene_type:complete
MEVVIIKDSNPGEDVVPLVSDRKSSDVDRSDIRPKRRFRRIWAFWAMVALLWLIAGQQLIESTLGS